jgi:hypothetical protein
MSNINQNNTYTLNQITPRTQTVTQANDVTSIKTLSNQLTQNIINKHL